MSTSAEKPATPDETACVSVPLGKRSYDVIIGGDLLEIAGRHIAPHLRKKRVGIVTDETVAKLHLETLQASLRSENIEFETFILPAGESTKDLQHYSDLMNRLLEARIGRDECLVAFGGGVIGDLTGFAASTLRRGIDFIQIPTTLLSQVDSSVGGKTGINTSYGKNLIGAFYQPKLVLADVSLLDTLPRRDILAGYAEVLKYGLLGDFDFYNWLETNGLSVIDGDTASRIYAVKASVQAKADIVVKDEFESGVRAHLNLGHTFGHALEAEVGYGGDLVHGEGVALGMLMAMELSAQMGLITSQDSQRVRSHYSQVGLLQALPIIKKIKWEAETLLRHMYQDKKVDQGKLTFILMKAIGNAFTTQDVTTENVLRILDQFIPESAKG